MYAHTAYSPTPQRGRTVVVRAALIVAIVGIPDATGANLLLSGAFYFAPSVETLEAITG